MTAPSPEQLAVWREEAIDLWLADDDALVGSKCENYTLGFLRSRTEQAAEIAALNDALLKSIGEIAGGEEHVHQLKAQMAEFTAPFAPITAADVTDEVVEVMACYRGYVPTDKEIIAAAVNAYIGSKK